MSSNIAPLNPDQPVDQEIDTRGTRCPLPLLRAKQALKTMHVGELLRVLATDPAAKPDFDAMLRHLPHEMVSHEKCDDLAGQYPNVDVFIIKKGER